ncbi:MAG: YqcI/YcgG family protein [Dehalococcoidia bacterium]|nr:YqcI/YcgG family protein [Dehalococcoidia bacterium]
MQPTETSDPHATGEPGSYSRWEDGALVGIDGPPTKLAESVHGALRAVVLDPEFPCVGARSALNRGTYRFAFYDELDSEGATSGLARDLVRFARDEAEMGGEFTTFIASFEAPKAGTPEEFEQLLWAQLHRLHEVDTEPWDPTVSADPEDGRFSFSFGGEAFFIVGLSPTGTRWGRRFPWPTLAFNPHAQFERLRDDGRFARLQATVRERDLHLEGDLNPNLADFGAHTEARQYSGRPVEDDWRCPVHFE